MATQPGFNFTNVSHSSRRGNGFYILPASGAVGLTVFIGTPDSRADVFSGPPMSDPLTRIVFYTPIALLITPTPHTPQIPLIHTMRLSTVALTLTTLLALTRAAPIERLARDDDATFSWGSASPDVRTAYLKTLEPSTVTLDMFQAWPQTFQQENAGSAGEPQSRRQIEEEGQDDEIQEEKPGEVEDDVQQVDGENEAQQGESGDEVRQDQSEDDGQQLEGTDEETQDEDDGEEQQESEDGEQQSGSQDQSDADETQRADEETESDE
ncbi:hypothetical protein DFH08DRAFT_978864 [Mycena albidolilacea]|uniref:Uncharacterized protein n=1 Tax=Mycena albidolilacea TaxID=1033008 RepID=A0AAD7E6V3_9AGAR|nr:hypothetical protein DFH08DRAFT_978864 [Mycena albidolilacea]